MKLFKML